MGIWILTGPVRISSGNGDRILVSFGFMSGRELYEHGVIYEMEKIHRLVRLKC